MQIKFLTLCHAFDDREHSLRFAQDSLLHMWKRSIQLKQVEFIPSATIEFKEYSFFDYPDQEKAKKKISDEFGSIERDGAVNYYWAGTKYPDLDTLYKDLAEQKHFMELTITPVNI